MGKSRSKEIERKLYALSSYISPRLNTKLLFFKKFGRWPELKNPKTLNEKLLKQKLESFASDEEVRMCADKYRVREFVKNRGCGEILNELLAVYDSPTQIRWDLLPDSFVTKWNVGCGYNIICPDKTKLDKKAAVSQLEKWGREDFWAYYSELQYRNIPKKLIVEKYLSSACGERPEDYKFYCFHGRAYCVMLCLGRDKGWPKFYFFDRDFKLLRINRDSKNAPEDFSVQKPKGIDEAFAYADRLSEGFDFVRTDLYIIDGRVYFGELTFTPAAALDNNRLPETDLMFGSMI